MEATAAAWEASDPCLCLASPSARKAAIAALSALLGQFRVECRRRPFRGRSHLGHLFVGDFRTVWIKGNAVLNGGLLLIVGILTFARIVPFAYGAASTRPC